MIAIKHFLSWLALFCFGLVALQSTQHGVEAARLAATQAAREEAAMKLEQAKTPEELQKEKERMEKIKADIESLLNESKEYKQSRSEPARCLVRACRLDFLSNIVFSNEDHR